MELSGNMSINYLNRTVDSRGNFDTANLVRAREMKARQTKIETGQDELKVEIKSWQGKTKN